MSNAMRIGMRGVDTARPRATPTETELAGNLDQLQPRLTDRLTSRCGR